MTAKRFIIHTWKPDGSQLLSKGTDGTLRLWDAQG